MNPNLITEESYRNKVYVFRDRHDAGGKLSQKLIVYKNTDAIILAIPSGGVPVASEIAKSLNLPLDLILVRKIQIPWNPEAGFGAINPDGAVIFNEALLNSLSLTEDEINSQIKKTKDILRKRNELFRGGKPFPEIKNKIIILVDDGLASGYTMLSALRFVKKREPRKIIVAVPTGSLKTVEFILPDVDELICLNIRSGFSFAVADAYRYWYDLMDEEVQCLIKSSN
jgi:predicted phosphoribosyltransferase